jgi:hypothetical protein
MTLIFTESFDLFAGNTTDYGYKWFDRSFGNATLGSTTGRFGGSAAQISASVGSPSSGTGYIGAGLGTDYTTFVVGFAMNIQSLPVGTAFFWVVDSANTTQLYMAVDVGVLAPYFVRSGSGTRLCTSSRSVPTGSWVYVEVPMNISATAGWCEIWLDGTLTASYYGTNTSRASSNGNTLSGLAAGARTVRIGCQISGSLVTNTFLYDDLYVCNTAGTVNNDRLGDVHVMSLLPTGASAAGGHTQFTIGGTTPAATNYQSVNEATPNVDVTYVADNTVGHVDTYAYADLPTTASVVRGVAAQYVARKDDAGLRQIQAVVRQSGTDAYSPSVFNLGASYQSAQLIMETNPVTGLPWTVSDVNGDEFGFRVYS